MVSGGKADALGIVFPNMYDKLIPDLTRERLMASVPFGSRYRMIDFVLSSMVNSGIDNISLLVRKNYHSLLDHLGSGREWDLSRKNGGLNIFPPYAQKTIGVYGGRVDALHSIMAFLKDQKEKYVVMSDTNVALNFDFNKLVKTHAESGADVTIVYEYAKIPETAKHSDDAIKEMYYTLDMNAENRVTKMNINPINDDDVNLCMNIYVMDRELLIEKIREAALAGKVYFERDILIPQMDELVIKGYQYEGYAAHVCSIKSYFDENMKLLEDDNLNALFSGNPIYTKIRDDNPTRYIGDAVASNALVADGCVIEGEVENCILFRGVKIGKGAKVKNCVLMQDTVVEAGADVEYVITDKKVTITEGKEIKGTDSYPFFIAKKKTV